MTKTEHSDAWVCVDCYFAHHYGAREINGKWWTGPDFDTASHEPCDLEPGALLAGLDTSDNTCSDHYVGNVVNGNGDDVAVPCVHCGSDDEDNGEQTFSRSRCDGCGSSLGGSRYRLAVWS